MSILQSRRSGWAMLSLKPSLGGLGREWRDLVCGECTARELFSKNPDAAIDMARTRPTSVQNARVSSLLPIMVKAWMIAIADLVAVRSCVPNVANLVESSEIRERHVRRASELKHNCMCWWCRERRGWKSPAFECSKEAVQSHLSDHVSSLSRINASSREGRAISRPI